VIVDQVAKAKSLLKGVKEDNFKIHLIVSMDDVTDDAKNAASDVGVKVMTFAEIEAAGEENLREFVVSSFVCKLLSCAKSYFG